jgi:hypothetical protein
MPARKKKNQRGTKKGSQRLQGQKRKGTTGNAANFVTRKQAIKKLQVSLQQFRKLCIIHGIYPRDPRNSPKGKDKTYFYMKGLLFLFDRSAGLICSRPNRSPFLGTRSHDEAIPTLWSVEEEGYQSETQEREAPAENTLQKQAKVQT